MAVGPTTGISAFGEAVRIRRREATTAADAHFGAAIGANAAPAATPARVAGTPSLSGLDAILALQGEIDPDERRKNAIARRDRALDALERLKIAMLGGGLNAQALADLRALGVGSERDDIDDPGLQAILTEIDVRAAVELAKLDRQAS